MISRPCDSWAPPRWLKAVCYFFFESKNPTEAGIYAPAHRNEYSLAAPFYGTEQKKAGLLTRRPARTVHRPRGRLRFAEYLDDL